MEFSKCLTLVCSHFNQPASSFALDVYRNFNHLWWLEVFFNSSYFLKWKVWLNTIIFSKETISETKSMLDRYYSGSVPSMKYSKVVFRLSLWPYKQKTSKIHEIMLIDTKVKLRDYVENWEYIYIQYHTWYFILGMKNFCADLYLKKKRV